MEEQTTAVKKPKKWWVGFTGSRLGTTDIQLLALSRWLERNVHQVAGMVHGGAFGADEEAACLFHRLWPDKPLVMLPSVLHDEMSEAAQDASFASFVAMPPLARNQKIVRITDILLACPSGPEVLRSGTWATVRYAQRDGRHVLVFWPNGEVDAIPGLPPHNRRGRYNQLLVHQKLVEMRPYLNGVA